MDKKLIYALIIGILIISFSIAYYLVIFLPAKEKNRIFLQNQEQVSREALKKELFDCLDKIDNNFFKNLVPEKTEELKDECYKKYPQK